jgi:hypothetical protein
MTAEDALRGVLPLIPDLDLAYDGDCRQNAGLDLPIAVVNLPHRTDRWQAITTRMAAVGLDRLIKVPAVVGATLDLKAMPPALLAQAPELIEAAPKSHYTLTRPAVGCFLSHLAIWKWILARNVPRMLIFEDDAYPARGFDSAYFFKTMQGMPEDAGLVLLGRITMNGMAEKPKGAGLARIYFYNGTFAYLITPAACRFLIRELLPMNGHIDHQISRVLIDRRRDFSGWSFEPPFFEPDWSLRSDCYIPLDGETEADRILGKFLAARRQLLLDDGHPLLARWGEASKWTIWT